MTTLNPETERELAGFLIKNGSFGDLKQFIAKVEQRARDEALKEYEDRDIEVTLDTKQCLEVAQQVYQEYEKAMQPPVYAVYQFPDWLNRQLTPPTTNDSE